VRAVVGGIDDDRVVGEAELVQQIQQFAHVPVVVDHRVVKSLAAATVSSSIVSIRFLVSGPVSSTRCLPTRPKRPSSVASSSSVAHE
jgi:hypothetical protein